MARFRCEMRDALRRRVINAFRARADKPYPTDQVLAAQLEKGEITYAAARARIKDPDLKGVFGQYAGATILYDFSLTMTEANDASGGVGLTRPFSRGSQTLGFSVESRHKRQNIRAFTIEDTFGRLLDWNEPNYCESETGERIYALSPNFDYPVTGQTRLEETLLTFLDLNQSGNLGRKPNGPKTPALTDDLQFTTKYGGSISPGFTFSPLARVFDFSSASAKLESSREDLHRVTIVLALPEPGAQPAELSIAESRQRAAQALNNAYANRTQINVERIADRLPLAIR